MSSEEGGDKPMGKGESVETSAEKRGDHHSLKRS